MRTEWSRRRRSEAYTEFRLRGAGLQRDFSVTFHGRHHSGTQRPLPYFNLTSGFLDCVRKNSRLILNTSSHLVQGHNATCFEPLPIVDELEAATFFPSFSSSSSSCCFSLSPRLLPLGLLLFRGQNTRLPNATTTLAYDFYLFRAVSEAFQLVIDS